MRRIRDLTLDLKAEGYCTREADAHIVHATSEVLTKVAVPSLTLNLKGSHKEQSGEAALELYLGLRSEIDLEIFDSLIKDAQRHLNAKQSLEDA